MPTTVTNPSSVEGACSYYAHDGLVHEGGRLERFAGALKDLLAEPSPATLRGLFRNRLPSGEKLTPYDHKARRPLTDVCYGVPKSVSVMAMVGGDERLLDAVSDAAYKASEHIEEAMTVRPRGMRMPSGRGLHSLILHFTGRPEGGKPDPQVHGHMLHYNVGEWGGRRYTADFKAAIYDTDLHDARFLSHLARNVHQLGYDLRQGKHGWEIAGVSEDVVRAFSRRTEAVEAYAEKHDIKAPKAKAAIASYVREGKVRYDAEGFRKEWLGRLSTGQQRAIAGAYSKALERAGRKLPESPDAGLKDLFERDSVVAEKHAKIEYWKRHPLGDEPDFAGMKRAVVNHQPYIATPENVAKEKELIEAGKRGTVKLLRTRKGNERRDAVQAAKDAGAELVTAAGLGEWVSKWSAYIPENRDVREPLKSQKNSTTAPKPLTVHVTDAHYARFADVHRLAMLAEKEGFRVTLHGDYRDYRKPERGRPMSFMEDVCRLPTGQQRPVKPHPVKRVGAKAGKVLDHVRRVAAMERLMEHEYDGGRSREAIRQRELER